MYYVMCKLEGLWPVSGHNCLKKSSAGDGLCVIISHVGLGKNLSNFPTYYKSVML